jgi:hypothetical protein
MSEISEDLQQIVSTAIESIKAGLKGKECSVAGGIEFEVAVVKSMNTKGGFRFIIAEAGGNYCKESVSKIKFLVVGNNNIDFRLKGLTWLGDKQT